MGISLLRLRQAIDAIDLTDREYTFYEYWDNYSPVMTGNVNSQWSQMLPVYDPEKDRWQEGYGYDYDIPDFEFKVHFRPSGMVKFAGELDTWYDHLQFHSLYEFMQYFDSLPFFTEKKLKSPIIFKEFPIKSVIEEVYISINASEDESIPKETFRFAKLEDVEKIIGKEEMDSILGLILEKDLDVREEIDSWSAFCRWKELPNKVKTVSAAEIPVLYFNGVLSNCDDRLSDMIPYLGFKLREDFSAQYLYDFLTRSTEGSEFLNTLSYKLLARDNFSKIKIVAPNSFIAQIRYSIESRKQYLLVRNLTTSLMPQNLPASEMKTVLIDRKGNLRKVVDKFNKPKKANKG